MLTDTFREFHAIFRIQLLGIVQADDAPLGIENDRGGDNGTKQRTTPGFVETRDASPAKFACLSLETGTAQSAHEKFAMLGENSTTLHYNVRKEARHERNIESKKRTGWSACPLETSR
jgi:hypothetical protein